MRGEVSLSEGSGPFQELVGLKYPRIEKGYSQCVLAVSERLLNLNRSVHGGAIYTLADAGMGAALYSTFDKAQLGTTIEVQIAYFKPVTSGTLTCDTRVVHKTRTFASLESEITNDGRLVAKATGTYHISKAKH
jgi:acyl-CoA thioesterase